MLLCRRGGEGAVIGFQRIDVEQRAQQFGRRIRAEGDHRDKIGMGLVEQRSSSSGRRMMRPTMNIESR